MLEICELDDRIGGGRMVLVEIVIVGDGGCDVWMKANVFNSMSNLPVEGDEAMLYIYSYLLFNFCQARN